MSNHTVYRVSGDSKVFIISNSQIAQFTVNEATVNYIMDMPLQEAYSFTQGGPIASFPTHKSESIVVTGSVIRDNLAGRFGIITDVSKTDSGSPLVHLAKTIASQEDKIKGLEEKVARLEKTKSLETADVDELYTALGKKIQMHDDDKGDYL